jgi:glycosyltransferase involved in cell wall biosynthesis
MTPGGSGPTVLMVTIGYPPDQVGGTEVYVLGLVEALQARGYRCHVAYVEPFEQAGGQALEVVSRTHEGTSVHVVRVNRAHHRLEFVAFDPATRARLLEAFDGLVRAVRPDLVHLHPLTLGFESYLIEHLKARGQKVVLTYHSSTTGCARGDLVQLGREVCDGLIRQRRCTACLYHARGVPRPVASLLSWLPLALSRGCHGLAGAAGLPRKLRSFFSIPLMIEAQGRAWARATGAADAVVAVCRWVREVLLRNRVPAAKITLARHGLRLRPSPTLDPTSRAAVSYGYLGRISPEKGIGILLDVLETLPPDVACTFDFCSATFASPQARPEERPLVDRVRRLAGRDSRVRVCPPVGNDRLAGVLAGWDALVVPSLWLESGPQVVYEAFSVRTPVIGSDRGGIAELVDHGRTGFLVPPADAPALREVLLACARDPARLRLMRPNIGRIRTTDDVAADMDRLYAAVLDPGRGLVQEQRSCCSS